MGVIKGDTRSLDNGSGVEASNGLGDLSVYIQVFVGFLVCLKSLALSPTP